MTVLRSVLKPTHPSTTTPRSPRTSLMTTRLTSLLKSKMKSICPRRSSLSVASNRVTVCKAQEIRSWLTDSSNPHPSVSWWWRQKANGSVRLMTVTRTSIKVCCLRRACLRLVRTSFWSILLGTNLPVSNLTIKKWCSIFTVHRKRWVSGMSPNQQVCKF